MGQLAVLLAGPRGAHHHPAHDRHQLQVRVHQVLLLLALAAGNPSRDVWVVHHRGEESGVGELREEAVPKRHLGAALREAHVQEEQPD